MHWLETEILRRLTMKSGSRYSDLRPDGVENNAFTYHLNNVLKLGLVAKAGTRYSLTTSGKNHADRVNLVTFDLRAQPKIVTVILCIDDDGRILLYRRKREPFSGLVCLPYGKLHLGERIADAAARELREKTQLEADPVHRGDAYLTILERGEFLTQLLCHIFVARNPKGSLIASTVHGESFWDSPKSLSQHEMIPGFPEIITLALKPGAITFFKEIIASGSKTTVL